MADRDDVGERLARLEATSERHETEITGLRDAKHRHGNLLTAHSLLMKFACAVSAIVGAIIGAGITAAFK